MSDYLFSKYLIPDVQEITPSALSANQPLIDPLSERELEVLTLIADGLSNREISQTPVYCA